MYRIAAMTVCLCISCTVVGSGRAAAETRKIPSFRAIEVDGAVELRIRGGASGSETVEIQVVADDNILPLVATSVENAILKINIARSVNTQTPIKVTIPVNRLDRVELNGAIRAEATALTGERLEIEANGASVVQLAGAVTEFLLEVNGASEVSADGLRASTVRVGIHGAGKASVCALSRLDASIAGAGKVEYTCDPAEIHQDISGVGKVVKKK